MSTTPDSPPHESCHVISVLVENRFGVLARISNLFAARSFNIDSLAVGTTHDPTISRMTVVVRGDDRTVEQIQKQLNKLIEVIKVQNLTETGQFIDKELILVKVAIPPGRRTELLEVGHVFKAKVIDITPETLSYMITGHQEKLQTFLTMIEPFGILELARTGRVALIRGTGGLHSSFLKGEPAAAGA